VDAVNGAATLDAHQEAVKQAAVADRILLTKTDLSDALGLRQRLQSITSGTPIIEVRDGGIEPEAIFHVGLYDPSGKPADVRRWLHHADHHHHADHDPAVQAHCLSLDAPVRWSRFAYWLELLAAMRGENMLRVKGIVRIEEDPERPVVIHGVQHVFHPPIHLDAWPSDDHRTRLVFITRDMPRETLAATLEKFALAG
jgi:G3E family GTPase